MKLFIVSHPTPAVRLSHMYDENPIPDRGLLGFSKPTQRRGGKYWGWFLQIIGQATILLWVLGERENGKKSKNSEKA